MSKVTNMKHWACECGHSNFFIYEGKDDKGAVVIELYCLVCNTHYNILNGTEIRKCD